MAELRHLLVVIPGIGGSVLTDPADRDIWQVSGTAITRRILRPSSLRIDRQLAATGLTRTLTALGSLVTISGYDRAIENLRAQFDNVVLHTYRDDEVNIRTNVLAFPYDFRQSVERAAERLDHAIESTLRLHAPNDTRRRVIVVAHSLGGLVARYWIGPLEGWRRCAALLTLGTPHRGAPKALDWLVNGVTLGTAHYRAATDALRSWPSMYELLPQYPAVWEDTAARAIEFDVVPQRYSTLQRRLDGYLATFMRMAAAGRKVHDDIRSGWSDIPESQAPLFQALFTRGHGTPNMITLNPSGHLRIREDDPPWRGNVGWRGDGTVPAICALPADLNDDLNAWRLSRQRHGDMADLSCSLDVLDMFCGDSLPVRGRPTREEPALGLDHPEVITSGMQVPVTVRLLPRGLAAKQVKVDVWTYERPRVRIAEHRLMEDGAEWSATIPPLPEGSYELRFQAMGIANAGSVFLESHLVVDDDPNREAQGDYGPRRTRP
jgi:hypothetical protein